MINVLVWNEFRHEKEMENVKAIYPDGIHEYIANFLRSDDINVKTAYMDMEDNGLSDEILDETDVLIYWAHCHHDKVSDEAAKRVQDHVLKGMGVIFLHSAHKSKPFMNLIGTTGNLKWRDDNKERIWCCKPSHPIAKGIPEQFVLDVEEMYGEPFDIPNPDDVVFIGWFDGGEVFRSGCTFTRGYGKMFYFQPGHETCPTYHNPTIQQIIKNAVEWAAPVTKLEKFECPMTPRLEP